MCVYIYIYIYIYTYMYRNYMSINTHATDAQQATDPISRA